MSLKRTVGLYAYDDDEDYVPSQGVKYREIEDGSKKIKKHTLDSDEEDDVGDTSIRDILHGDDIDGQEEKTFDFEGDTKITPFNMKEEMEEGHFDADGFYHFKKEKDQIKDAWLDDIDWIKIKRLEGTEKKYGSDIESGSDSEEEGSQDTEALYKEIFTFMIAEETVAKTLKLNHKSVSEKSAEIDMFSEDAVKDVKLNTDVSEPATLGHKETMWEYRLENKDDSDVHGPYSTEQMLKWQNSGFFKKGVYVRKVDEKSGSWYTSKRIDFDLYL